MGWRWENRPERLDSNAKGGCSGLKIRRWWTESSEQLINGKAERLSCLKKPWGHNARPKTTSAWPYTVGKLNVRVVGTCELFPRHRTNAAFG